MAIIGDITSIPIIDIDDDFIDQIEPFIAMTVHPENVVVKKIGDKETNARLLFSYARTCSAQFACGKLPKVENLWRVIFVFIAELRDALVCNFSYS